MLVWGQLDQERVGFFKRATAQGSAQADLDLQVGCCLSVCRTLCCGSRKQNFCRGLIDGELYLDSFTEAKYNDPTVRGLMAKMTITPVKGWSGNGPARTIIRKKNGEERVWDTNGGRRTSEVDGQAAFNTPMTSAAMSADRISLT